MDIISTHKISRPVIEAGIDIDTRPKGAWHVSIRRSDGTIRKPFGDSWIPNGFISQFIDNFYGRAFQELYREYNSSSYSAWSLALFIFGANRQTRVGSSDTPYSDAQISLGAEVASSSIYAPSGNSISISPTTGDMVMTVVREFAAPGVARTYREAGLSVTSTGYSHTAILGLVSAGMALLNRVVFPAPIEVGASEVLILTTAITFPTLAGPGARIETTAQNGMDISGLLKLIGTQEAIAGGTVTGAGVPTLNIDYPYIPSQWRIISPHQPVFGLTTATTHPAFGTNTTGMIENQVTATFSGYAWGQRYRDLGATWGPGVPASDTTFRSITLTTTGTNGYQLLLDSQQTKSAAATLSLSLRFSF